MQEIELKFCPDCGTKNLEVERGFTKTHCANCGNFFNVFCELGRGNKKGFLLLQEKKVDSKDPNFGKTEFQICKLNPGMKENHKRYKN